VSGADRLLHEGELYLSLEVLAEVYQVRVTLLREVYERGLLGSGVDQGTNVCIASVELDRVAMIVRLHSVLGLDLDAIATRIGRGTAPYSRPASPG